MSDATDNRFYREPRFGTGLHEMDARTYHADPCETPSLSASIAKLLLDCPRKAWFAHPKLGNGPRKEPTPEQDFGSAVHARLLGKGAEVTVVDAKDWRGGDAKKAKAEARAAGKVPILAKQDSAANEMIEALRPQLMTHEIGWPFEGGHAERALIWQDEGIWCRSLVDYWRPDLGMMFDYKSTEGSASPDIWFNRLSDTGANIQNAFYVRGAQKAGVCLNPSFRFIVQETHPPYCASVIGLEPQAMGQSERDIEQAISDWRECLRSNRWPGYPAETCWVGLTGTNERRREGRELRAQLVKQRGVKAAYMEFMAP